jgi:membrane-associated protein
MMPVLLLTALRGRDRLLAGLLAVDGRARGSVVDTIPSVIVRASWGAALLQYPGSASLIRVPVGCRPMRALPVRADPLHRPSGEPSNDPIARVDMHIVTDVLSWLQTLPQPAVVAVTGLFVLLECSLGLGFLVPGEGALLVAATTVTTPQRFLAMWLVVTAAAFLGDTIGHTVGRRFGPRLRETTLIRRHGADGWDRAAVTLRRHGAWAVLFARFLPVVRTLVPPVAGTSGLPLASFVPASVAGAAAWSALHIAVGSAAGSAAQSLENALSRGGAFALAVLAVIAVVVIALRTKRRRRNAHALPACAGSSERNA